MNYENKVDHLRSMFFLFFFLYDFLEKKYPENEQRELSIFWCFFTRKALGPPARKKTKQKKQYKKTKKKKIPGGVFFFFFSFDKSFFLSMHQLNFVEKKQLY